jgi:hypothetical protein
LFWQAQINPPLSSPKRFSLCLCASVVIAFLR